MYFDNDTDLYRVIGSNIKHYREQAKLTQVQLAEQAQISISYLSKIEAAGCNKSLSISVLNQIANVLGVEISEFFKEVDHEEAYGISSHELSLLHKREEGSRAALRG